MDATGDQLTSGGSRRDGSGVRRPALPQAACRRRLLGSALAASGAVLAACGGLGSESSAPQGAVRGKVLFWQESSSDLAKQLWSSMQSTFKEVQPNVALEFDATPVPAGQSRDDKLFATLASGSAWDVWQRDIPPSYQQPLVDKKAVLALDEYYASQPNLKRIHPWARSRSKLFGKTWGVPHEVEFIPVWFNKGVLAKAGIKDSPKTWDQYTGMLRTLKASGVQPLNIAKGRTNPGHNYSVYLMGLIGKDGFEDLLYRDKKWDGHEGVIRAAQTLVDFEKQGWIPADNQTGTYDVATDFQNGKLAMWGNGTWAVADFDKRKRESVGFDYDFFIPPSQDAKIKPTIAGGIGGGFSIWSETKNVLPSVAFLDHLMSPTAQKLWIELYFNIAPVPFKPEDYKVPEGMASALKTIASGQEMGYNVSVVVPAKFVDVYWDGLVDILNEKLTPKEWTTRLQKEWDSAKQENRTPKP